MKARLVRIGNSRGVRLPKALIKQAALGEEVDLEIRDDTIVISKTATARRGWAEAAAALALLTEDGLVDAPNSIRFDREEWEW